MNQKSFQNINGRCQCGSIQFIVSQPAFLVEHCHCSMCRRLHGALYGSYAGVNTQHFSLKSNKDSLSIYASSKDLDRHFCKMCGCHIFFKYKPEPENVYYCIALLNKNCHPGHNPKDEKRIFVGSKSCFHEIEDNLPKFDER